VILAGFPNPVGWALDRVSSFVGDAASSGFEAMVGGLTAWVVDAVVWLVGGVFDFFLDSTDPNVQADWFITGDGPYATTAALGGVLLVVFVFAGIAQGIVNGDVGGMLRRIALELPMAVLGMVGLVTITQLLIRVTDELSGAVLSNFQDDVAEFGNVVGTLAFMQGQHATAFVVFLFGLVTVIAGLVLVAELVVRASLIYIVVALAPLVFASRLWPATKGASRKLLDLLVALILSKLVIAIALGVAAAAAVGTGSGGEVTALASPEVFAEDPGGSVTQAVGILLTAAAAFGVSAFSPLLIARLLPMTEAAVVAQGIKGAPARAAQQGLMAANTLQMVTGRRYGQPGGKPDAGAGIPPVGAGTETAGAAATGAKGSTGAAAAAGPAAAVVAVAQAAKEAVETGAKAATATAGAASENGASSDRDPSAAANATGPAQRPPGTRPTSDTEGADAPSRPDSPNAAPTRPSPSQGPSSRSRTPTTPPPSSSSQKGTADGS
jgi:hypothetical protein